MVTKEKYIFGEITSKANNVNKDKGKENGAKSPVGVSWKQSSDMIQILGSLSSKPSADSEFDEDHSCASESDATNDSDCDTDGKSSDYLSSSCSESSGNSDDESCLSYSSSKSSVMVSSSKMYLKEVKRRTKKAEAEYRDSEERRLKSIHLVACRHLRNGNLKVAQEKFEEILATLVEDYGEYHARVGGALHNLGIVHLRAGNLREAKDAIKAAIRIRMKKLGEYHPKVAVSEVT